MAEQTPGSAGEAALDLGHEGRRLLVADQDVANGGPGERIGEVDVLFSGDAEQTGDTLVLEALDEEFGGTPSSFSHRASLLRLAASAGVDGLAPIHYPRIQNFPSFRVCPAASGVHSVDLR